MTLLRLLAGTVYDLGRLMSGLSLLAGIGYLARGIALDNPADATTAVAHFVLGCMFWIVARIFRRYAI